MSKLSLNNVTYKYKNANRNALNDVSCDFAIGKVTAIAGPSGSGKTTLLSIIAGLDIPTKGQVIFDGKDVNELNLDHYRKESVSLIFQGFHLFALLSALENVCFPLELKKVQLKEACVKATKLLESVGIGQDKHNRYPANLSGGEQQRVAIARALATGARILLADEPTGNLDVENGRMVMDVLRRLAHEQGYTVIIVTHNPEIVAASDIVYQIVEGMLQQEECEYDEVKV
jgi:putative ABC transport system ATP-binding protein